ncbi:MAG: NADH-quinone oxidoreductase subunit J [Pyrinomonadaceae bacterium]
MSLVTQRNPLYCAISLIGVFISLACIYVTLASPFIAAVQVVVYAGAIMVLVVFVIMLLNVEAEEQRPIRRGSLIFIGVALASLLLAEAAFVIYFVGASPNQFPGATNPTNVGLTTSIGVGLFTKYLLPFEITSVLLLMAIVGSMTLARRTLAASEVQRFSDESDSLDASSEATRSHRLREVSSARPPA